MIVVEGPDGAGKTTFIEKLVAELDLPVAPRVVSKDAEAMVDLKTWTEKNVSEGFQATIFDRHRLVSEPIYGAVLRDRFEPGFDDVRWLHEMFFRFYEMCRPIIIYCLPPFEAVRTNIVGDRNNEVVQKDIRRIYALYAARAASDMALRPQNTFRYDYTDGLYRGDIIQAIKQRVSNMYQPPGTSNFDDVGVFHAKFGLRDNHTAGVEPTDLPSDLLSFRIKFMLEELMEFATANGYAIFGMVDGEVHIEQVGTHTAHPESFDALLDLVYVALGTAHLFGYPWQEGWDLVQKANMAKERATRAEQSERGGTFDVIKPEGWTPPDIGRLLTDNGWDLS